MAEPIHIKDAVRIILESRRMDADEHRALSTFQRDTGCRFTDEQIQLIRERVRIITGVKL